MANTKYSRIIAIATTISVIVLGILFMICCAHLYFTGGEQPYSRESVGKYLLILAVPSIITIALVVLGLIYNMTTGEKDEQDTSRTNGELLDSFTKRFVFESFPADVREAAQKERNYRQKLSLIAGIATLLFGCLAVLYFVLFTSFTIENLNGDVLTALAGILPLAVCAVAVHIPKEYLMENSSARELNILKESIKVNGAPTAAKKKVQSKSCLPIVRYAILGIAVLFVIIGIFNGGMADVLAKAVKICTECIGLG